MAFPILGTPKPQFFDASGNPLASGTLEVRDPATDNLKATYPTGDDADNATNANSNPITLDSRGECDLWGINAEAYKLTLKDSFGATIWTVDDVDDSTNQLLRTINPQTAAEVTAAVTISDYSYKAGDPKRYGAAGDGVADDTTPVNDAIKVSQISGEALKASPGTYLVSALTPYDASVLRIYADGDVTFKEYVVDQTMITPLGSVDFQGVNFQDFMIVVSGNSVAAGSTLDFENCEFLECGDINPVAGRTDFQAAITAGTSANSIDRLSVKNCVFDGDDFGVAWQGPFERAEVSHNTFQNMHRMGVMLGNNTGDQKAYQNIDVSHNYFKDIIGNEVTEDEIHGALSYGHRVTYANNVVDTCYDTHTTTHNSEALYAKAVFYSIHDNHVIDGGRGNAFISVKGATTTTADPDTLASGTAYAREGSVRGNTCYSTAAFETAYTVSSTTSGILVQAGQTNVSNNTILGNFSRGIVVAGSGVCARNRITGDCEKGVSVNFEEGEAFYTMDIHHNQMRGDFTQGIHYFLQSTAAGGNSIDSISIKDNKIISTAGITNNIWVDIGSATTAANTVRELQIRDNVIYGFNGGEGTGVLVSTGTGGLAENADITLVRLGGGIIEEVTNAWRFDGAAGDVTSVYLEGGMNNNITNRLLSNFTQPTNVWVRGCKGQRNSEITGTATLVSGNTNVTVTMSQQDTLRPDSLEQISVTPIESLGSASYFWIDTLSGDNFNINVNVNPAADVDFVWSAKSRYHD